MHDKREKEYKEILVQIVGALKMIGYSTKGNQLPGINETVEAKLLDCLNEHDAVHNADESTNGTMPYNEVTNDLDDCS